jgi:hypothetical protein
MLLLLLTSLPPYFLASSFHESQVTKSPVVHPLSVQLVTKCFSRNSFVLKMIHLSWGCTPLNEEIMNSTIAGGNDGRKVFNIAQTPAPVAISMALGQELDDCCTAESTDPWASAVG